MPLILRGPAFPPAGASQRRCRWSTPIRRSSTRSAKRATAEERKLPGTSLLRLLDGEDADRTVFSEYHAVGSMTGIFMVRFGRYKYIHYEGYRPQLFDLEADPMETRDLALEGGHDAPIAEGESRLRAICDPAAVSARAFADQERRIEELGGSRRF